jgi:hypothetical protein
MKPRLHKGVRLHKSLEIIWPQKTTMKPRLHRGVRHIAEKEGTEILPSTMSNQTTRQPAVTE